MLIRSIMFTKKEDWIVYLGKNREDEVCRLVYADFLDEQGEHEEAERMRKWLVVVNIRTIYEILSRH